MKEKDRKILRLLKQNSRLSVTEMSERLDIPDTTIHYRLKKLDPYIKKYTVVPNYTKMGMKLYLLTMEIEKYVLEKVTREIVEEIYRDLSTKKGIIGTFRSGEKIFVVLAAEELDKGDFDYAGVKNVEYIPLDSFEIL